MLRLYLQPKLKIKLVIRNWTRGKMIILLKYIENIKIEGELQKIMFRNGFGGVKLRGSPLFIDTIKWKQFRHSGLDHVASFDLAGTHHQSILYLYFGPIICYHIIGQFHISISIQ